MLIDVRTTEERAIVALGGLFIPLSELLGRVGELDPERETVVYCHHGVRSAQAVAVLRSKGFVNVKSLAGGIDRWVLEIDASLQRY